MFDKILRFGAGFDWISPLWKLFQDQRHGSAFQIHVPYGAGWSGGTIVRALRQKGITVWGEIVVHDVIMFTVTQEQAEYALYWLRRWGIPIESHSPFEQQENMSGQGRSMHSNELRPHDDSATNNPLDKVLDAIGKWT